MIQARISLRRSNGLPHYLSIEILGHAPNNNVCAVISAASMTLNAMLEHNPQYEIHVSAGELRLYNLSSDDPDMDRFLEFYVALIAWLHDNFKDCFLTYEVKEF